MEGIERFKSPGRYFNGTQFHKLLRLLSLTIMTQLNYQLSIRSHQKTPGMSTGKMALADRSIAI